MMWTEYMQTKSQLFQLFKNNDIEAIKTIIADFSDNDKNMMIRSAVCLGNLEIVKLFYTGQKQKHDYLCFDAVLSENIDVLQFLIEKGHKVLCDSIYHSACNNKSKGICYILNPKNGAVFYTIEGNPNIEEELKECIKTALGVAICRGNMDFVRDLHDSGIDCTVAYDIVEYIKKTDEIVPKLQEIGIFK